MSRTLVLDSEPFSLLTSAHPKAHGVETRLRQLVAKTLEGGGQVVVPVLVVAEARRRSRSAGVDRAIKAFQPIEVDLNLAKDAGSLLHTAGLGSEHMVDATVMVTAAAFQGNVAVITGDSNDPRALGSTPSDVTVIELRDLG